MKNKKITERNLLAILEPGGILLSQLVVRSRRVEPKRGERAIDALVDLSWKGSRDRFQFVVNAKSQNTPAKIRQAIDSAKAAAKKEQPMIVVPFLSPDSLDELEQKGVSGVDLCGNGLVIVPGRLLIRRTGQPNQYRDSRPLNNPYAGRSALIARMLLERGQWSSLNELTAAIREGGEELSLAQASKAIKALQEELIISRDGKKITLIDSLRLLDRMGQAYRKPRNQERRPLKLPKGTDWAQLLSSEPKLRWSVTGESSTPRYVSFAQAGPPNIAVSDLSLSEKLLKGALEFIPQFADLELIETNEPGYYFKSEIDQGVRFASRIQTWLELQAGDARQQEAARDLREQILKRVRS